LVVYLHGGGWTIGGLDTFDRVCRRLAAGSGARRQPAAVNDDIDPRHTAVVMLDLIAGELNGLHTRPERDSKRPRSLAAGESGER
jgi:alpha/beta hydrolase fold